MGVIFKHRELEFQGLETPTYKLSAIVGADSFFYAIENGSQELLYMETALQEKPLAFYLDPFDFLNDLMAENPLLFETFHKKQFAVVGVPYLITPKEKVEGISPVRLLSSITYLAAKDDIRVQDLPESNAQCIFAIPEALKTEIELYFEDPGYTHVAANMREMFAKHIDSARWTRHIHLHAIGNQALFFVLDRTGVIFQNQFYCAHIPDMIYFLGALVHRFGWSKEAFTLSVTGQKRIEIEGDESFRKLFGARLREFPSITSWPLEARDYIDLYATSTCAS